ncbi:MAG TPA: aminomethyltransferase family protein, partial [Ilumatobacteraceae bacterium]|nr:aminomethyltransferase family protein [Ilumatobacteraceae bacterium]
SVQVRDVTSARGVINLCGPLARDVLQTVCEEDVSNAAFRYGRAREITIGAAPVLALRIGYTGELGWELHIPTEYTAHVYDVLWDAGQPHGIVNAGYRAIDRLRVEKGYVYWSTDVTPDTTPLEAGLEWRINWDKADFCGRDALVAQRAAGLDRQLCTFTLEEPPGHRVYPVSGEAIILGDDVVGFTTTANFGDTIDKPIAFGYVPVEHLGRTDWVIEVYGEAIPATRHDGALYDPKGARLRA